MTDSLSDDLASLRIDRGAPPPSSRGGRWVVALGVFVGVALVVRAALPELEARVFRPQIGTTEVASVAPTGVTVRVTSTGYVTPQRTAKVAAKVVGRVASVRVREGESVREGQPLFELETADVESAIASARARAAAAMARVAAAKATLAEAATQAERQARLASAGAVPVATADDLAARVRSLEAQARAQEAEVAAAEAEVRALVITRGNYRVIAPMDGTILTKPAQVGDVVNPGMTGPLVELADFASLLVETDVPEGRLGLIAPEAPCEIVLEALPGERFRGRVVDVGPRLNRSKATAMVKVAFEAIPARIRPEMSARVSFLDRPLDAAQLHATAKVVVPGSAVAERAGRRVVFVLEGDRVRETPVELGEPIGSGFELLSGPRFGTRLVKDPPTALRDGQAIKEKTP
jgi:HlyD family secretion protein